MTEPNWALARKRKNLEQRARITQAIRAFFVQRSFLEVETPQRLPGNAPEFHIDVEQSGDWFLQTSPELCMKRLLAAGCPRLFQLCRCWRRAERGRWHLPEFTLLEWYRRDADYLALMRDCESLVRALVPDGRIEWQGQIVDLAGDWQRLTVDQAFRDYADCAAVDAVRAGTFDRLLTEMVEPRLGQERPTFLYDYPIELGSLARSKPGRPDLAERVELYIAGIELANGFSELTDSLEQERRFAGEEKKRREAGKPAYPLPDKFLVELGNLQSAAGIALGLDRLVMLLCNAETIDQVVAFSPEEL